MVRGKPFVSPRADDASWRLAGPVPSATEFLAARQLASEPWPAPSICRPACAPCSSACSIVQKVTFSSFSFN